DAAAVAVRAGVTRLDAAGLARWQSETGRTTYLFDVRTPEEYAAGHVVGFRSAPGGQLVQETDVHCPVRGARIVLTDDDGVRASMTASWLVQMGWQVAVLSRDEAARSPVETGADIVPRPPAPEVPKVDVATLAAWLEADQAVLIDVTTSANFVKRHIPGAVWALRAQLAQVVATLPPGKRVVLTCASSLLAYFAAQDSIGVDVLVLDGGNAAWVAAGLPTESGDARLASPRIDRYRRPYEGTDNAAAAMQAYLDWEFGLVEQLRRDGTHHFEVI
ncbi:MAG: rhodanese-related sulfurtransferase, partial [Rhizobacter sp.]|nr:rhodanese-related sulfurtransferase [Rhizobacter sp.]